ncbi:hypothetical protein [Virgisporangium aurantiacum]|uniref:Uncharacterized protein n=1 Tax=Virgisporangium aurantiacum TaxID=175570 RepID=A0A8J3ZEJ1_9ACTN|nr:hypothetical protein [Virgisporangium aurantiacum]GIJ62597.1 hypothetical protein Vau01_101130 [Virgisporangium aurantiacum]
MSRVDRELRYLHPNEIRDHPWPEHDNVSRVIPDDGDDGDGAGGAGVREPRDPLPRGGRGAAERPGS